jgi:hypothetical protein
MSFSTVTPEDYKFFDYLAPKLWTHLTPAEINVLRNQVKYGIIQLETMLENALAKCSKKAYKRIAEAYRDFCDNSDSKKSISQFRNNSIQRDQWMNSFAISGLKNKIGLIRAVCYSKEQDKFYCFAIPHKAYKGMNRIDIILDQSTGYKVPQGIPKGKWTRYMLPNFTALATITEAEANRL